jgi:hypothetical protein
MDRMCSMNDGHAAKVRRLEIIQTFHRFYLRNGIVVSMALMFATEVVALTLDKHGWNKSATVAMKLFELSLIISVLGPICFFVNLLVIGNWRCPRCHDKPTGWVEKEAKCLDCGLEFRTH